MRQLGRGKPAREFERGDLIEAHRVARIEDIGKGDFLSPRRGIDRHVVILQQQRELFGQIIGEDRRFGDADPVFARRDQPPERAARGGAVVAAAEGQTDFGIGERAIGAALRTGRRTVGEIGGERGLKAIDGSGVEPVEFGDDIGCSCHPKALRGVRDTRKTSRPLDPRPRGRAIRRYILVSRCSALDTLNSPGASTFSCFTTPSSTIIE